MAEPNDEANKLEIPRSEQEPKVEYEHKRPKVRYEHLPNLEKQTYAADV